MTRRIALFARPPVPGRVKTRLTPALTPGLAYELYRACLGDALDAARSVPADERIIYWAEPLAEPLPFAGFVVRTQRGEDLGARLAAAFHELIAAPGDRALILGADCPELDGTRLASAFDALADADVVLGPTRDGGYYLIALARVEPRLFEGVAWSTPRVLDQTLERAATAGLRVSLLDPLEDLDTPADLVRFIVRAHERSAGRAEGQVDRADLASPATHSAQALATHAAQALAAMGLLPR